MSRLLQAYIVGWAFVLGMLIIGGGSGGQSYAWIAFEVINLKPWDFAATAIFVWFFYSVPCAVIFAVGFLMRRGLKE
jgi:hypothetical protein